MNEVNYAEGQMASKQADHERDVLIRGVFAEYQVEIPWERSTPFGLNSKYDVLDLVTGKTIIIHDERTITCGPLLATDIRNQLAVEGVLKR
jgi:hypothetical protein